MRCPEPPPGAGRERARGQQSGDLAGWGLAAEHAWVFSLGRPNPKPTLTEWQSGLSSLPSRPRGHPVPGGGQEATRLCRLFLITWRLLFRVLPQWRQRDGSDPAPAPETGGAVGKRVQFRPRRVFSLRGLVRSALGKRLLRPPNTAGLGTSSRPLPTPAPGTALWGEQSPSKSGSYPLYGVLLQDGRADQLCGGLGVEKGRDKSLYSTFVRLPPSCCWRYFPHQSPPWQPKEDVARCPGPYFPHWDREHSQHRKDYHWCLYIKNPMKILFPKSCGSIPGQAARVQCPPPPFSSHTARFAGWQHPLGPGAPRATGWAQAMQLAPVPVCPEPGLHDPPWLWVQQQE